MIKYIKRKRKMSSEHTPDLARNIDSLHRLFEVTEPSHHFQSHPFLPDSSSFSWLSLHKDHLDFDALRLSMIYGPSMSPPNTKCAYFPFFVSFYFLCLYACGSRSAWQVELPVRVDTLIYGSARNGGFLQPVHMLINKSVRTTDTLYRADAEC